MIPSTSATELPNKAYLLPDAIAMWPPVWWTWPIIVVLLSSIMMVIWWWIRRYHKRAYRREALALLNSKLPQCSAKDTIVLCHELIRRCLVSLGQEQKAALSSRELVAYLDIDMPTKRQFSQLGDIFISAPYQQHVALDKERLDTMIATTRYWIRRHRA
ncbi:DUF4381 domain-containing protein [Marinomonas sp. THO17]|uniref:DUF4381 domain-containing protein n=1 Tax=Marinomonas sp. THO17 TaxID=3149048 RepID=UPI00336BFFE7